MNSGFHIFDKFQFIAVIYDPQTVPSLSQRSPSKLFKSQNNPGTKERGWYPNLKGHSWCCNTDLHPGLLCVGHTHTHTLQKFLFQNIGKNEELWRLLINLTSPYLSITTVNPYCTAGSPRELLKNTPAWSPPPEALIPSTGEGEGSHSL